MRTRTLVTGGTGWIGQQLIKQLESPLLVSRNAARAQTRLGIPSEQIIECDLGSEKISADRLNDINAVVNLMGDSIADGRWNADKKKRIRDSRVQGTRNLCESLIESTSLPDVLVSASAIGYYGERGDDIVDESQPPGNDFLSEVCVEWEQAAQPLIDAGVRACFLRVGIVLGQGGGAIGKMLTPFKLGVGGRISSGQQWMSWIHLQDIVNMIQFLITDDSCNGAFNGTSPQPVRNIEFTKTLGKAVGRPTIFPVPSFALKLALGEFADFLCMSQRVVPNALEAAGFEFQYPGIQQAIEQSIES